MSSAKLAAQSVSRGIALTESSHMLLEHLSDRVASSSTPGIGKDKYTTQMFCTDGQKQRIMTVSWR